MDKGYQLIVAEQLDSLLKAFKYADFLIAIYHWLIEQLYIELGDQLDGIQIEVIKIAYVGAYPGIGVHYESTTKTPDLGPLIEETINRLLREKPIIELIMFIGTKKTDWNVTLMRIMTEGK